jgi:hypothetical protein
MATVATAIAEATPTTDRTRLFFIIDFIVTPPR